MKDILVLGMIRFKNNFSKDKFSIGLDIGTQMVKMVKLRFSKGQAELFDFNLEPFPSDAQKVLENIKHSQGAYTLNLSVSGPATIIRYVNFPRMNEGELKGALKFEAQKHIPFSINEAELDSYIIKEDLSSNNILVLLAAVKKEFLAQRLKIIEEAGLKANVIDMDSLALINAFNFNYSGEEGVDNKAIALLNIGAAISNLNILERGTPRLSRDIHIAGNNFTQKIMDMLNMDFKSVEELKLNPQQANADKVSAAIDSVSANLAVEIRTSFDYYESQGALSVAKIFLSGGSSLFAGLKDMLANLLGIEVEYWDPLRQIAISPTVDSQRLKMFSRQLAVAAGLALRK